MHSNLETINKLRWVKTPVLSDGFICLVDCMGADEDIVQAARVSYNRHGLSDSERVLAKLQSFRKDTILDKESCKEISAFSDGEIRRAEKACADDDAKLLRMLYRQRHTTPFEQCEVKFLIRIPMDAWRQGVRHRTASINEYSTRYTEAIDSRDETPPDGWRLQAKSNKQGSSGLLTEWPETITQVDSPVTPGEYLSNQESWFHRVAQGLYQERLEFGIAKEQARKDLPLSTYTELYWKCDLHNIFHFLGLRMDSHAQLEIRLYANAMFDIVKQLFPIASQAFLDYRFNAFTMTALDTEVAKLIGYEVLKPGIARFDQLMQTVITDKREQDECRAKFLKMGLIVPNKSEG